MTPTKTTIQAAGVLRCCIQSLQEQLTHKEECAPEDTLTCEYCQEVFELTKTNTWVPLWQL